MVGWRARSWGAQVCGSWGAALGRQAEAALPGEAGSRCTEIQELPPVEALRSHASVPRP